VTDFGIETRDFTLAGVAAGHGQVIIPSNTLLATGNTRDV